MPTRTELIVALDVPTHTAILPLVDALPAEIAFYKVGLELFIAAGPATIQPLADRGKQVFLDLKLHDIPRTVANAVKTASDHGVALLTIHAHGGKDMMRAAAEAAQACGPRRPRLLAVTTLTSLNDADLIDLGIQRSTAEHSLALARQAISCGIDGLVCSPLEAGELRRHLGPKPILVTPGIRPAGSSKGDQKRIATPADAVKAGADYLVVGRPILGATDPRAAAEAILAEISDAINQL